MAIFGLKDYFRPFEKVSVVLVKHCSTRETAFMQQLHPWHRWHCPQWCHRKPFLRPKGNKCRNISAVRVSAKITAVITAVRLFGRTLIVSNGAPCLISRNHAYCNSSVLTVELVPNTLKERWIMQHAAYPSPDGSYWSVSWEDKYGMWYRGIRLIFTR